MSRRLILKSIHRKDTPILERLDVHDGNENPVARMFYETHIRRYQMTRDFLLLQNLPKNIRIVDAACALGYGYEYVNDLGNYLGLDYNQSVLDEAKHRYPQGDFRQCDLNEGIPHWGPFDVVISHETVEHLKYPEGFIRSVNSCLKPRGLFMFAAPTSLMMDYDPFHTVDYNGMQWRSMLTRNGFEILRSVPISFTGKFTDFVKMAPTTLQQKLRVATYGLIHSGYAWDRIWNWVLHNRFTQESTWIPCRKKYGVGV